MDIEILRDIKAICETGSFRKAARELGVSQPTLSYRISRAEQELGQLLFERGKGKSTPTALALLASDRANGVLGNADLLLGDLKRVAQGRQGHIHIGMGPAPASEFFPELASQVQKEMPTLSLTCETGKTETLMEMLLEGQVDFAVCPLDLGLSVAEFHVQKLIGHPVQLFFHPDHTFAQKPPSSIAELFSMPVATTVPEPMYVEVARQQFDIDLKQLDGMVFCSNMDVLLKLLMTQSYSAIAPVFAFRDAVKAGELLMTSMPTPIPHQLCLFRKKDTLSLPAVDFVVNLLIRQISNQPQ